MTDLHAVIPAAAGQTRVDQAGQLIKVVGEAPGGRFTVVYPYHDYRPSVLSPAVIEAHYPEVLDLSDPRMRPR